MSKLKLGIPKGSLQDATIALFERRSSKYVLVNGGGSGGGERGRVSMRRFAREVMPLFTQEVPAKAAE